MTHPQVKIRTQSPDSFIASTTMPDGRILRVVGTVTDKVDIVDVLKNWITWIRRGSFS